MGIKTSEVGYTSAKTRRETTKSMTDMWWHWKIITTTLHKLAGVTNNLQRNLQVVWEKAH
jgi:hypothetical protein